MGLNVWGIQVFSAARADSFFMSIREHVFKRDVSLGIQVHSPSLRLASPSTARDFFGDPGRKSATA